jgi:hypothetical protein
VVGLLVIVFLSVITVRCFLMLILVVLIILEQWTLISSGMENSMVVEHHGGFIFNCGNVLGVIVVFGFLVALLFIIEAFSALACFVSVLVAIRTRVLWFLSIALTLSVAFPFSFIVGSVKTLAFSLSFGILVSRLEVIIIALAFAFPLLATVTPPVAKGGRVVGYCGLFVVANQFRNLKLGVTGKTLVCVEFDQFVEREGTGNVCIGACCMYGFVGFFSDGIQKPVNLLLLGRRMLGVID